MHCPIVHLKRYPLTLISIALTWYLCLVRVPSTPFADFENADKWAHVLMYFGTCSLLWFEYWRSHKSGRVPVSHWLLAVACPILMSGAIELCQEYFTDCRSGDWRDFLANSIGVALAAVIGQAFRK